MHRLQKPIRGDFLPIPLALALHRRLGYCAGAESCFLGKLIARPVHFTTAGGRPRSLTLWRSVPQRPGVLLAARANAAHNRGPSAPGTSAGQREQQTPPLAGFHPRSPDQKAPTAVRALPTGRDSSGFRRVLGPRANARTGCSSGQPYPAGQRITTCHLASARVSARRSRDRDNQHAPLAWERASRLPATQTLTGRTSVVVSEL